MAIVRRTRAEIDPSKIHWASIGETTDAEIATQIAANPDTAPIFSDEDFARARRVVPESASGDVKAIRQRLGLSQEQFALRFGFSVDTIRNYEQGHRRPTGPAWVLLRVIAAEPEAVTRALSVPAA
jgi:putative transcriptional regulator